MSLTDGDWTQFQIDNEIEYYATARIVKAHNEIRAALAASEQRCRELEQEQRNTAGKEGYEVAAYWRDRAKVAECDRDRLQQEVERLRVIVDDVRQWGGPLHGFHQCSNGVDGSERDNLLFRIMRAVNEVAASAAGGE